MQRVLVAVAERAEQLVGEPRDLAGGAAGDDLRDRLVVVLRGGARGHRLAGEDGEVLLDGLEAHERAPELLARAHVGEREVERAGRRVGDALRRRAGASVLRGRVARLDVDARQRPGDDRAQDLGGAAAQGERRGGQQRLLEQLVERGRRAVAQERPRRADGLDDVALVRGAEVLDQRGLHLGRGAVVERGGHAEREPTQRDQPRGQLAERGQGARVVVGPRRGREGIEQREGRQDPLGAAALVGELGDDLRPAAADLAEHHLVGHVDAVEGHLVPLVDAVHEVDRAHRDPVGAQVDDELRQPGVAVVAQRARAAQDNEVVRPVRPAGPLLDAVQRPAAVDAFGAGGDRCEVRAAALLAHADRERDLAARHAGHELLALRLGAEAQQRGPGLAVGDPVRADRGARGQQLLDDHVALQRAALAAAVAARPGHAQPAAGGERAAELRVGSPRRSPGVAPRRVGRLGEEGAHLGAQRAGAVGLAGRRQGEGLERAGWHGGHYRRAAMSWLDRDGVRLYYEIHDGPEGATPLLLTHGFAASAAMWSANVGALSERRRVAAWDLRGHARSDAPGEQALYSHDLALGDMAAVL